MNGPIIGWSNGRLSASVSNNFSLLPSWISFHMGKKSELPFFCSSSPKFAWTLKLSQNCKSGSMFSSSQLVAVLLLSAATASLQPTWKRPVFVLAHPTSPSCAPALPKEPHYWLFCSQNLWLPSWIAFRSDCQMTCRGSNLDLNFNSAAWTTSCHGLSALKSQNNLCGIWIVLTSLGLLKNPNWGRWWGYTNPHPPDWHWWFWVYLGPAYVPFQHLSSIPQQIWLELYLQIP